MGVNESLFLVMAPSKLLASSLSIGFVKKVMSKVIIKARA